MATQPGLWTDFPWQFMGNWKVRCKLMGGLNIINPDTGEYEEEEEADMC